MPATQPNPKYAPGGLGGIGAMFKSAVSRDQGYMDAWRASLQQPAAAEPPVAAASVTATSAAPRPVDSGGQTVSTERLAEARRAGIDLNALLPAELAAFIQGGAPALQKLRWDSEAASRGTNPNLVG